MERLLDLSHDLGKYLRMPLMMLGPEASQQQLQAALRMALLETRRGPSGVRTAREIWRDFHDELAPQWAPYEGRTRVCESVERALSWEAALRQQMPLQQLRIEAELRAVGEAIDALIDAQMEGSG